MPRPRFYRLEQDRRSSILDSAAAEFGERGFEAASYNRIIERAGLSKGAMYYYFDDKQDLYITVLSDAIERFLEAMDPPTTFTDADDYWTKVEKMYGTGLAFLVANPRAAALARSFVSAPRGVETLPAVDELYQKAQQWMKALVTMGQGVNAVRTDIDSEVIAMAVFALGESMNNHAIDQLPRIKAATQLEGEAAVARWVDATAALLIDMVRRLSQP